MPISSQSHFLFTEPSNLERQVEQARMLMRRLERLSVDSIWARRASGCRGSLLKWLEAYDAHPQALAPADLAQLKEIVTAGFFMLESAAREVPEDPR